MKWDHEGIILKAKRHGETSWILSIFSREKGRHLGLGRSSPKSLSLLQPGNRVHAEWSARLSEHLGQWKLELLGAPFARLRNHPLRLSILTSTLLLLDHLLAERHPYPEIYEALQTLIQKLESPSFTEEETLKDYCYFEVFLLEQLGYALDLTKCGATGQTEDLTYVSPRTGRAVCQEAAAPYVSQLLHLPLFLKDPQEIPQPKDLQNALYLTGYFLAKHFFDSKLPEPRERLEEEIRK